MSYFLAEQTIMQEANVVSSKYSKAIFWMVVQTADEQNQNTRVYPFDVLQDGINNRMDLVRNRCFYGEMDHPIPVKDSDFNEVRQTTVLLQESSHIITDFQWEGKHLYAQFETLTNRQGMDLFALIRDKTRIGASMRGLAELERKGNVSIVTKPLTIITYDIVSMPSHKNSVIDPKRVTFESLSQFDNSSRVICEHKDQIKEKNGLICTSDGICYLPDYFDKLVESNIIKFFERWV